MPARYRHDWTKEEEEALISLYSSGLKWEDVRRELNERFGLSLSLAACHKRAKKLGVKLRHQMTYTKDHDEYILRELANVRNYRELAKGFNEKFGTNVDWRCLQAHALNRLSFNARRDLKRGGDMACHVLPLGSEVDYGDGYIRVKVGEDPFGKNNWMLKSHYMYKQYHGDDSIKEGDFVAFLNGDHTDYSEENLCLVSRKTLALMNRYKWFTESREHTLTAIRYCELYFALKERSNNAQN